MEDKNERQEEMEGLETEQTKPSYTEVEIRGRGREDYVGQDAQTIEVSYADQWKIIMTALGLKKSAMQLERDDMIGKVFTSIEEAEKFYYLYGRLIGFSVRKGHMRRKRDGGVRYRTWLCYKQGERDKKHLHRCDSKREPKQLTRERCKVEFCISYNKLGSNYVVREFVTNHSHAVALNCYAAYLWSFRQISMGTKTKVKGMHRSGVKTAKIMSYMAELAGGYDKVGIWPRDLQNCIQREESYNLSTCDAAASIGYLQHKAEHDAGFFAKYSYDEEKRLLNMFWSNSRCQKAYVEFGDSIAFDTTYKCNKFRNPVTILVGINHHGSTSIFGFALLADETVETYVWVLETFLECMRGKLPATVVTDGDLSMKSAIAKVMDGTIHRLCSWHLCQNAISNVKDPGFLPWLQKMMTWKYEETMFDSIWYDGVAGFGLQENAWIKSMYARRKSWAETYLRGHFFAGMVTTQRCEGMHAYLKSKVDRRTCLVDFIRSFDLALSWLRMNESKNDFESTEYRPVIGRIVLASIEIELAALYTHKMFLKVRDEMSREGTYYATNVDENDNTLCIKLVKYGNARKVRVVSKSIETNTFSCECNKLHSEGIPCRHIFAAMKTLQITRMPKSLIMKRWMKNERAERQSIATAASISPCNFSCTDQGTRFGQLMAKTTELAYYASLSDEMHDYALKDIDRLITDLHRMTKMEKIDRGLPDIKNLVMKRTKGAPATHGNKNLRICSNCRKPGHNKATCKRKETDVNTTRSSQNFRDSESITLDDTTRIENECAYPTKPSTPHIALHTDVSRGTRMTQDSILEDFDCFIRKPYGQ